jgi:SSS family solute:Na+ symporter
MIYLVLILGYAAAQIALGLVIARRVKASGDFFVAGRALGPGLIFSTFLAANIGAGSTVGAAGLGYRDGLAAWWWVGSAGIGSIVLALWVGPRIRAIAAAHDLRTVGDFLEWRYDRSVRAVITALLWAGSLAILAGQLIGLSKLLTASAGWPFWAGCLIGGAVLTIYSSAGGLKSSVWVNVIQVTVKMAGFLVALPLTLAAVGGLSGLRTALPDAALWNIWGNGDSGWIYVAMLAPAFVVSPGLLQKIYGARDDRAVRVGVGLNAVALLLYAIMPVLLGMCARVLHPGLADGELALPMLLVHDLPPLIGALTLAAVFSAEISSADAVLFMLTTSLSQDLYKRFVNPQASDRRVLTVARVTTLASGTIGIAIALVSPSIIGALKIFYTLLGVSLFVPVIAGLYGRRAGVPEALAAIAAGVSVVVAVQLTHGAGPLLGLTPPLLGLLCAAAAWLLVAFTRRK